MVTHSFNPGDIVRIYKKTPFKYKDPFAWRPVTKVGIKLEGIAKIVERIPLTEFYVVKFIGSNRTAQRFVHVSGQNEDESPSRYAARFNEYVHTPGDRVPSQLDKDGEDWHKA